MKIRVPESDIYIDTFNALHASPTPLAYSETFTALQQGTVDGFEIVPAVVLSNRFFEVCSNISIANRQSPLQPKFTDDFRESLLKPWERGARVIAAPLLCNKHRPHMLGGTAHTFPYQAEPNTRPTRRMFKGILCHLLHRSANTIHWPLHGNWKTIEWKSASHRFQVCAEWDRMD